MSHLIQEIKDLFHRPRLLIQYLVLNFFLISVGVASVMYTKKELVKEHTRVQSEQIIITAGKLDEVPLPKNVERSVNRLKAGAEKTLEETGPSQEEGQEENSPKK